MHKSQNFSDTPIENTFIIRDNTYEATEASTALKGKHWYFTLKFQLFQAGKSFYIREFDMWSIYAHSFKTGFLISSDLTEMKSKTNPS